MVDEEKWERFWVTLGAAILSLFFMAPADVVEIFSCLPKRLLDLIPSSSRVWTFVDLSEITVGLDDRFYLHLALVLNIFRLGRIVCNSETGTQPITSVHIPAGTNVAWLQEKTLESHFE